MEVIRYGSTNETKTYSVTPVPTSETDAIVLKDSDVDATSVISVGGNTQGTLFIKFTKGSLTNCVIKMYGSYLGNPTATDWYQESEESSSSGEITLNPLSIKLTADTVKTWHFPIGANRSYRITVTGTGTATSSSLDLTVGLRNN